MMDKIKELQEDPSYQRCVRCVMDTTDPDIEFDEDGLCNHCRSYFDSWGTKVDERPIEKVWEEIKDSASGDYDAILGISGGADSCWLAYVAKEAGLNLLLVHADDGFDTDAAVKNVEMTVKHTGYDIEYYSIPEDEMLDIIRAYFKAGVVGLEAPSDNAYNAVVFHHAEKFDCRIILSGGNYLTEDILPAAWNYNNRDATNIKAIHKEFGTIPLKRIKLISFLSYIRKLKFGGIREFRPLNQTEYIRKKAIETMVDEWNWVDYGRKHNENRYTRFIECYVFPKRFGIDKRLAHYSTLVCSNQMSRDEALRLLEVEPLYTDEELTVEKKFALSKLGFSEEEFERLLESPVRSHHDFKTFDSKVRLYRSARKLLGRFF